MAENSTKGYEQFLLFPQCFHKNHTADTKKPGLVWERVNLSSATAIKFNRFKFCPVELSLSLIPVYGVFSKPIDKP